MFQALLTSGLSACAFSRPAAAIQMGGLQGLISPSQASFRSSPMSTILRGVR